jgi:uncharacterized protein (TIGR03437 family)
MGVLWLAAGTFAALGQQYTITTVAGGAPPATPVPALSASIGRTNRVAVDQYGTVYFSTSNNAVFKLIGDTLTLIAGNSRPTYSGDGGPAVNAGFNNPQGIVVDTAGNIFIADSGNNRVRKITTDGIIRTVAGNGTAPVGYGHLYDYGDNGLATDAQLSAPSGLALDSSGNLYIADTGNSVIRKVDTSGIITTFAGNSYAGFWKDKDYPTNTELNRPTDVAVDASGYFYIADSANNRIRVIDIEDGYIKTMAGTGEAGSDGDKDLARDAKIFRPFSLAVDSDGTVYFTEYGGNKVRVILNDGDTDRTEDFIYTIAGTGASGDAADNAAATKATFNFPTGLAMDTSRRMYVADSGNLCIRKMTWGGGIAKIAGNGTYSYSGDGGKAIKAQLSAPSSVAADSAGNFYFVDSGNNVVRKVDATGVISNFAGNGTAGYSGDGGSATGAALNGPHSLAVDSSGNVYIADTDNARVRKVSGGTINTVAGNGTQGYGGDGGAATSASLNSPAGLALDTGGNLYIADSGNNRVRKVSSSGVITTFAGAGAPGYSGDGSPAVQALLNVPKGVAADGSGSVYIADSGNAVVRKVAADGTISTIAGTGTHGYSGDNGQAAKAQLAGPAAIAADASSNIFLVDSGRIRKILPTGIITTIAGTSTPGYYGDGGAATSAGLFGPSGIGLGPSGNVYIADSGNNAVRLLQPIGSDVSIKSVANGASNLTGSLAPGEVVVLYGSGLGPDKLVEYSGTGTRPTSLAGTTVYFNGMPAPVFYTSSTQVGAIVPYGVSGSSVQATVVYNNGSSTAVAAPLASTAPGLFTLDSTGSGQALAVNATDNSLNTTAKPANSGDYVVLYATGLGQTNPPGSDGVLAAVPLPLPVASVTATIGGKEATVSYAGGAQGIVSGVMQVNLRIPSGLTAGAAEVILTSGGVKSQSGVTVAVSGN